MDVNLFNYDLGQDKTIDFWMYMYMYMFTDGEKKEHIIFGFEGWKEKGYAL